MSQDDVIERIASFFSRHHRLTLWLRRTAKLIVVVSALGIIFGYSMLKYSEKPEFCKTCHYMEPFYEAWKSSSHNRVRCVECHYAPGIKEEVRSKWEALSQVAKYVTGTYGTKPWAEISDRSCLRSGCHDKRLLRGRVVFKGVIFDHASHLTELRRGKRLRCTSCHSQIVQGEHMTVTTATCVLCHFKGQREGEGMAACTLCHSPPSEPVTFKGVSFDHKDAVRMGIDCTKCHIKVTRGSGNVPRERCYSCHLEPERIKKYGDSILLHDIHITEHKVECTTCHLEMEHRIAEMTEAISLDCNSCHPDHHAAQKELYMGVGGKGVPHQPDPMFLTRVDCRGCHIEHKGSKVTGYTRTAPSAACMSCHGLKYGKMLAGWQRQMKQMVDMAREAKAKVAGALAAARKKGKRTASAWRAYEAAAYNIDLVEYGRGVHNISYSQQLILAAMDSLRQVLARIGSEERLPQPKVSPQALKSVCYRCHFGMYGIVRYREKVFPHELHVVKGSIPCLKCHREGDDPNRSGHGRLTIAPDGCLDCHHAGETECRRCHPVQSKVYRGQLSYLSEPRADFMASAGVECESCHLSDEDKVVRPTGQACTKCHDEDYAQLKEEWQGEVRGRLAVVRSLLAAEAGRDKASAVVRKYRAALGTLTQDGSFGVHNYQAVDEILTQAEKALSP